ncbi:MAG: hypothetical protein AAF772_01385 [Acidobacteriota bacterium]
MGKIALALIVFLTSVSYANAGVFLGTAFCSTMGDCEPFPVDDCMPNPPCPVRPFAITHPPGFDGSGGALSYDICVLKGSGRFIGPLQRAMATWNALIPTIGNCIGCKLWEDGSEGLTIAHAETTLLHELGHCPLGLDHPDRNWDAAGDGVWEPTSFTRSWDVANPPNGIRAGPDFLRGTLDDIQQRGGGAIPESVHWFRRMDNNPFAIDGTVIDSQTFSRSVLTNLPAGHSWAANANKRVSQALGLPDTQSVMYSRQVEGEIKVALTADEVNMLEMARTGVDQTAGTSDDYTVELRYVESCDQADVIIALGSFMDMGTIAACRATVEYAFPQAPMLARHLRVIPELPGPLIITLSQDILWDRTTIRGFFDDGFESGDVSAWSSVTP